jgi:hypothetical protein
MNAIVDEPAGAGTSQPARRMRSEMAAARLSFTWLGVRKALTSEQRSQAAGPFGAEGKFLSAGKKLLDTAHPAFRAVTAVRGQALSYWKGISLPFPEPGIRLIRQSDIDAFDRHMAELRDELDRAVENLQEQYQALRDSARERLGSLFSPGDYPETLIGLFAIDHDYPSVEPPEYLRRLSPQLYEQECRRVQARFTEAVRLAEQAFGEELAQLVDRLAERLRGDGDGRPKIFRDSAVTGFREFFERFHSLNIGSSQELDELVGRAGRLLDGVDPQDLRDSQALRERITSGLAVVQSSLDGLLVDRPRRNILRRPAE